MSVSGLYSADDQLTTERKRIDLKARLTASVKLRMGAGRLLLFIWIGDEYPRFCGKPPPFSTCTRKKCAAAPNWDCCRVQSRARHGFLLTTILPNTCVRTMLFNGKRCK